MKCKDLLWRLKNIMDTSSYNGCDSFDFDFRVFMMTAVLVNSLFNFQ